MLSTELEHDLRLWGHRGAPAERPENTLPSFLLALERGANALELDVHMTRDGQLVVSHDPSGRRVARAPERIRRSSLSEVKTWDAGFGFIAPRPRAWLTRLRAQRWAPAQLFDPFRGRPFVGQGYRMPTLEEVLVELPRTTLSVDIKPHRAEVLEPVLEVIRRQSAEHRVTLASFDAATIRAVRRYGYRGPTALARREIAALFAVPAPLASRFVAGATAAQVPVRQGPMVFGSRWFIAKCHALGLRVDFWTIDDPLEADRLFELGADGVMTNDPAALWPVFSRHEARRQTKPARSGAR